MGGGGATPAPAAGATTAQPGPLTREALQAQIDGLTERLSRGELTEALYTKLVANLEQRMGQLK
jgi:hypothetical protein